MFSDYLFHLNVSALLLEISRQFTARYTANIVPNTAHVLLFTLCELCSRPYTKSLQLRIFRLQYSAVGNCSVILDITTTQCALYCKLGDKYSSYAPVYAMSTVVPVLYNAFTAPHVQASIFIWTYLRSDWRYLDNSLRAILQTLCQIQRTSSGLRYLNCGPGNIPCI
jgi:hypothetical protein